MSTMRLRPCARARSAGKPQLLREMSHHRRSGRAQGREGAGRAAELHRQPGLTDRSQAHGRLVQPRQPARRLEPEGDGQRLLQQRPRRPSACPVPVRQLRGRVRRRLDDRPATAPAPAGDQHRRGVDDVLAGRPAVDLPGGRPGDHAPSARCTSAGTGFPVSAAARPSAASRSPARGTACASPRPSHRREQAGARVGTGQRRLDVEHRLQPRPIADRVARERRARARRRTGPADGPGRHDQTSKNTVSPAPCSWMSNRYPS